MAQPLRQLERRSHRKTQVLTASARLFLEYGYHNVSVDDIAAAVGLTGPALYRHFRNKHDILEQALDEQMSAFEAVTSGVLADGGPPETLLPRFLVEIGELVIAVDEALLWKRERRHLPPDERAEFRRRFRDLLSQTVDIVCAARPDLSRADAELFAWAVLSIHSNSREARGSLDGPTVLGLLGGMARAVVACDLTAVATAPRRQPVPHDRQPVAHDRQQVAHDRQQVPTPASRSTGGPSRSTGDRWDAANGSWTPPCACSPSAVTTRWASRTSRRPRRPRSSRSTSTSRASRRCCRRL